MKEKNKKYLLIFSILLFFFLSSCVEKTTNNNSKFVGESQEKVKIENNKKVEIENKEKTKEKIKIKIEEKIKKEMEEKKQKILEQYKGAGSEYFYISEKLGIRFELQDSSLKKYIKEEGNKIIFTDPDTKKSYYIQVFDKKEDETIEQAIGKIVKKDGFIEESCEIRKEGKSLSKKFDIYKIRFKRGFYAEYYKNGGRKEHLDLLLEKCSSYSKYISNKKCEIMSKFLYKNKSEKFIYLSVKECDDKEFFKESSIKILY